jgi:(p)ppGpp synthase/HD superfamily hydrolase
MKLFYIVEARALRKLYGDELLGQYKNELASVMPKFKRKHSLRVSNTLAKLGVPKDVVSAGVFHDYPERGGDHKKLTGHHGLSDRTSHLVSLMTNPDKGGGDDPLSHFKELFPLITDPEVRNHLILIKLSDRLDNLRRRANNNNLTRSYQRNSAKLVKWLLKQYTGPEQHVAQLIAKLRKFGIR